MSYSVWLSNDCRTSWFQQDGYIFEEAMFYNPKRNTVPLFSQDSLDKTVV